MPFHSMNGRMETAYRETSSIGNNLSFETRSFNFSYDFGVDKSFLFEAAVSSL